MHTRSRSGRARPYRCGALSGLGAWAALVTVFIAAAQATAAVDAPGEWCPPELRPMVVLETVEGIIEIEVFPDVAPEAVAKLLTLVRGPIFDRELVTEGPEREPVGYYDGLSFDHARPGAELATGVRPPSNAILIPTQVDAAALGLDQQRLGSSSAAMDLWQHEILPYATSIHGRREPHPRLAEWLVRWRETMRPDFLLEASQLEINEALGYRYQAGLPSLPVRRGSVGLVPASKEWSTPSLIIALTDRPELDGRRMVIGRVVDGLDLADALSRRRLTPDKTASNRPLVPVPILDGRVQCRAPDQVHALEDSEEP